MVPTFENVDKFPLTNGRTYCVGEWKSEECTESGDEAYIKLAYQSTTNLLLAVKFGGLVEIWDCKD
jgi:hypothetical protein